MSAEAATNTVVIGLEVHVQLDTATKIFCGCATESADEPNTNTCPVCLGLPGSLPVLNEAAVEAAVKVGRAIDATIPERTRFHRKNYYYPDLPKNFQITQYDAPICQAGTLEFTHEGTRRSIGIERAHLEEDPGSVRHLREGTGPLDVRDCSIDRADYTLIDYNRAGTPLMEIVTEPDFRDPGEVRAFLEKLEEILQYLGVYDPTADGSLRVDANLSLVDASAVGPDGSIPDDVLVEANRTEVKNISSHRGAERALAYEASRQRDLLAAGETVAQETRHFNETHGNTVAMRSKEEEKDYRYFREADLPPLEVSHWTEEIPIPELPDARRERFGAEYGLDGEIAEKLTSRKAVADVYEELAGAYDPDLVATWVADELLGELNYRDLSLDAVTDRLDEVERLVELVATEAITAKNAREVVLREMLDAGDDPDTVVEREGLGTVTDDAVSEAVAAAIADNPDAVADFHDGEDGALNFLVGQVMQATGGSADPGAVNERLRERLDSE